MATNLADAIPITNLKFYNEIVVRNYVGMLVKFVHKLWYLSFCLIFFSFRNSEIKPSRKSSVNEYQFHISKTVIASLKIWIQIPCSLAQPV